MISFLKKFKPEQNKKRPACRQAGMTFIELVVVLSIFAIVSSVTLYDYGRFQAKVDIKNLANDIALKAVEAQKSAMSGSLPIQAASINWKPSYGLYFNRTLDAKSFIYFTDLNNDKLYTDLGCTGECMEKINITKGNSISELKVFYQDSTTATPNNLVLTFTRPNSGVVVGTDAVILGDVSYVQITIISPQLTTATIKLYSSGRVQIN